MRKIISVLLVMVTLGILLSACGGAKPKIEDYEWEMRYVVHAEDGQAVYDAVAEESSTHPEANIGITLQSVVDGRMNDKWRK